MPNPDSFPWSGAWPWDVLSSFRQLTSDETIRSAEHGGLLRDATSHGRERGARIDELIAQYRAHDGYQRLKQFPAFDRVMRERKRLAAANPLFADPLGELRLAHPIATLVGAFSPEFRPKQATRADQEKVLAATRSLVKLLIPGAQPTDFFEMNELRRLLGVLASQLATQVDAAKRSGTRPARRDKDAAQRYWLVGFCKMMLKTFGEAPAAIVNDVAGMIDYTPDNATVSRYIKKAADLVERDATPDAQRKAMAEVLRGYGRQRQSAMQITPK